MGQPGSEKSESSRTEYIGAGSKPRELKHLSTWWKRKQRDSLSSGERKGKSLNRSVR